MRNIYEIISEQKHLVNVNIASYELSYITEHLINNDELYYVQEGLGESIKNAVNKVIEFIKKIIVGVKNLIKKTIGFFTGKKDVVKRMNDEIDAANAGGGGASTTSSNDGDGVDEIKKKTDEQAKRTSDAVEKQREKIKKERARQEREREEAIKRKNKEQKKATDEKRKNQKNAYKKANDINYVLKNSKSKVSVRYFCPLKRKIDLANKFFDNMNRVANELISKNILNDDVLITNVIDKTFRGRGSFDANNGGAMQISRRIELEIGEDSHEPQEYYISSLADEIFEYLSNANGAIKYLEGQEKVAVNNLNKLLKYLEQSQHSDGMTNGNEKIDKRINLIKAASSAIGEFVNVVCQSILRGYNSSLHIAEKAKNDYIDSIRHS